MSCRFSIIIVHRNGESMIDACLQSVHSIMSEHDEVIVVDNGSTDGSVALIKSNYAAVNLIENNCNNGFAAANNQAITASKGQICLLLNNDALLSADVLDSIAELFESQSEIAVVTPQLISSTGVPQRSFGYFMRPMDEVLPKIFRKKHELVSNAYVADVDSVIGACMAVRKEAITQVGMLDDDFFFYFEETEWCYRFKKHGYRVVLDRSIQVIHEKGESTRSYRKEAQIEMLRSRLLYYKKVFGSSKCRALELYRVMRLMVNLFFAILILIFSLGFSCKHRATVMSYGYQLAWIILGKPRSWGLPDKCPVGYSHCGVSL